MCLRFSYMQPMKCCRLAVPSLQALKGHSEEHAATLAAISLCAQHLQEILLGL